MASTDDINSTLKGTVINLAEMADAFASPGRNAQTTSSPAPTVVSVGSGGTTAVAFNATRRAISFHNSNPAGTTIWVLPAAGNVAIATTNGIPIVPGGDFVIDTMLGSNCGWNAIAAGTTILTVLEYV